VHQIFCNVVKTCQENRISDTLCRLLSLIQISLLDDADILGLKADILEARCVVRDIQPGVEAARDVGRKHQVRAILFAPGPSQGRPKST
jgi:hypothetical protein